MTRLALTRAELRDHPGFGDLGSDSSGNPCVWLNRHECEDCGVTWETTWSSQCDDECAGCGTAYAPYESGWISPGAPDLVALWEGLPEA